MKKTTKHVVKRGRSATRKAYDKAETRVMAAVGRSTVRRKVKDAKLVASRAGKSALVAGSLAAAGVVVSEVRKRHKPA